MNLRIAPEHLRFRISEDEFAALCARGILSQHTALGAASILEYTLRTHPSATDANGQILAFAAQTRATGCHFEVSIFADGVAALKSNQAGKDGIQEHLAFENGDMLTIGLEIDLHSKKGASKS